MALKNIGNSSRIGISVQNLEASRYSEITWRVSDDAIAQVYASGSSATVVAKARGRTTITVSHPDSINSITFYVFVDTEDIISSPGNIVYIACQDLITMLRDDQSQKLQAVLVNYEGYDGEKFNFSVDNESVVQISAQSPNGTAFIKPVSSGQAEITITNPLANFSKKVLVTVGNSAEELAGITYLTTVNNVVSIGEGKNKSVSVSVKNSPEVILDGYSWISSDYSIADVVPNGSTASIKANGIGTALITVTNKACKYPLQIIVHVVDPISAAAHPYIQLNSSVLVLGVDDSYTSISAELIGGSDDDKAGFTWTSNDSSICLIYGQNEIGKIKAVDEGSTYITVSHPRAEYSAQLLVICEKKKKTECYISVPSSIINMKPTDEATTITASLVNGTANDKYNFKWSLDVYDIIDFQYSANVCTIKPKQAGSTTITISHPKAEYDQQIIVSVQEYTTFAFPSTNITVTQGEVKFLNMQVPTTSVKTHIEYFVKDEKKCSVTGTKQVAQITGIDKGSTIVTAKLIATNTKTEQASAELMVYVKERTTTEAYITSGSTIYTVKKGKAQTLNASITGTGITITDQANLKWTTSDSNIIELAGLGTDGYVRGQSIYITAKKPGEAVITCSHDKATSDLEFYVVVTGTEKKTVTLNKSYVTITKGSSGSTLIANIENAESNDDYNSLNWTVIGPNGKDGSTICRVMGSPGKNVQLYPVSPGEVTVFAQLSDSDSVAKCTVVVEASKSLLIENSGTKLMPFETKEISYKVSPTNAIITWLRNSDDDYFDYNDLGYDSEGNGKLQITGIKEGQGMIVGSTDGGAAVRFTVKCSWNYAFNLNTYSIAESPEKDYTMQYTVNPPNARIEVIGGDTLFNCSIIKDGETSGSGKLVFKPLTEGIETVTVRATNPNADNAVIGSYPVVVKFVYPSGQIIPNFNISKIVDYQSNKAAYYSKMENGNLYMGDGESITFKPAFTQSKMNPDVKMTFNISKEFENVIDYFDNGDGSYTIYHKEDVVKDAYKIIEGYRPVLNESEKYSDGKIIKPEDFDWKCENETWKSGKGKQYGGPGNIVWTGYAEYSANIHFKIYNTKNNITYQEYVSEGSRYLKDIDNESKVDVSDSHWSENFTLKVGTEIPIINEWGKIRDTSLDGKLIDSNTFEGNIWYYIPIFSSSPGHHTLKHNEGEINSANIKAEYLPETEDTSVVSEVKVGTLKLEVNHAGINEKPITVILYLRTRNCKNTFKK